MRDLHCPSFRGGGGGLKDVHHLVAHVCSRLLSLDVCHFQPLFLPAAQKKSLFLRREIFFIELCREECTVTGFLCQLYRAINLYPSYYHCQL